MEKLKTLVTLALALSMSISLAQLRALAIEEPPTPELICGLEESEGHTHTDDCYATERILTCGIPENHVHTIDCYTLNETMGYEEEIDGQVYMVSGLNCTMPESHVHTDECYTEKSVLTCGKEESEGHQHSEECFAVLQQDPLATETEADITEPLQESENYQNDSYEISTICYDFSRNVGKFNPGIACLSRRCGIPEDRLRYPRTVQTGVEVVGVGSNRREFHGKDKNTYPGCSASAVPADCRT